MREIFFFLARVNPIGGLGSQFLRALLLFCGFISLSAKRKEISSGERADDAAQLAASMPI